MNNKQNQTRIHETVVKDLLDFMNDVKTSDLLNYTKKIKERDFKSLSAKTAGLTLVFPVYTSSAVNIETASMIAKAQERQAVSMLQLLFSAINISTSSDGIDFIKQIHNNIGNDSISIDKFIDIMDGLPLLKENTNIDIQQINKIKNDLRNLNFYLQEDFSQNSINDYKILGENYNSYDRTPNIILESPIPPKKLPMKDPYIHQPDINDYSTQDEYGNISVDNITYYKDLLNYEKFNRTIYHNDRELDQKEKFHSDDVAVKHKDYEQKEKFHNDEVYSKDRDFVQRNKEHQDNLINKNNEFIQRNKFHDDDQLNLKRNYDEKIKMGNETIRNNNYKNKIDAGKLKNDTQEIRRKASRDNFNDTRDRIIHQLLDNDVKKANELIPTLMIINFNKIIPGMATNGGQSVIIPSQMLIGIKAKLYSVNSTEMVNRIIIKNQDNNGLLKLVKATTREISFLSDFLLAIDRAKIDALARSKKGSDTKIFKVLERRANTHKFKRRIGINNADVAPISTFHITKEEVDLIKKMANIDVSNSSIIRKIMESYNLMSFVITDESSESASFIYDTGEDSYETLSYRSLERENSDNSAKKMINLMTKIAR